MLFRSVREVAVTENPWSKSLRWGPWRFVHYQRELFAGEDGAPGGEPDGDIGELYNIVEDPDETENLYYDPAHADTVNEARRLLLEWLIRTTRVVTSHPAINNENARWGKRTYPLSGDGRAPNPIQPRYRDSNSRNYL